MLDGGRSRLTVPIMSEISTKPYMLRAIYEWCTDSGYTPYLAVKVDSRTTVPMEYVKKGEIVLNISFGATSGLKMDNDAIRFHARFGGVSREIYVPVDNVMAIYANENGQGMAFPPPVDLLSNSGDSVAAGPLATPAPALAASLAPVSASEDRVVQLVLTDEARKDDGADGDGPRPPPPAAGGTRPSLKRIK